MSVLICVVCASSGCLLDNPVWRPKIWTCSLATSLRDVSVGQTYLAGPSRVRRAEPADLGVGGCPLVTSLRDVSVDPAYLAGPTRIEEGCTADIGIGGSFGDNQAYLASPTKIDENHTSSPWHGGKCLSILLHP